ncbi:Hypothetical predicted protein, partial [Paramuricea clavata]
MLTTEHPSTKTEIRRAIKKVKAESAIIEKIIYALKETVVLSDEVLEGTDVDTVIENLDKELCDIMDLVDTTIKYANDHIKERLVNGEDESEVSTIASSKISVNSMATKSSHTKSSHAKSSHAKSSHVTPPKSVEKSVVETQQQEVKDANDRLKQLEKDQQALEQELQKKCETFELNKERIKDARSIVFLNEARAKATERFGKVTEDVTVLP